ncbi:MAG: beta-lactamase family protein, partial [Proteobacteria bacterium]|nr:beta-lactamase family protein [Pseudomonadota bacterium]
MARILLFTALAACSAPVDHDGPWGEVSERMAETFEIELEEARAEQGLTGLAMAVAFHDDHTLWTSATGSAVNDPQADWLPAHTSRMGSVTKTFTAAIVHQLIEEGIVTLDDPVEKWVTGGYTGVTVEQLLGMSSGIVSYNYVGNFDTQRAWTPEELVQWAWDHESTLRFEPGTRWEYSNTNYVLLGLIIEAATGESYESELQRRLLDPLALDSMWLSGTGEKLHPDLVHCYGEAGEDLTGVDPSFGWAAGSLVSNPADLARWNDALYFGDVLSEQGLERMVSPRGLT